MKGESKLQIITVSSIVVIVISGIWFFGLSDEVTGTMEEIEIPDFNTESVQTEVKQSEDTALENNEEFKSSLDIMWEKALKEQQSELNENIVKEEPKVEPKQDTKKQTVSKVQVVSPESIIEELEDKIFSLSGRGTAYETPQVSKSSTISLTLKPIAGSKLTLFDILSGKITIDGAALNLEDGLVKLDGKEFSLGVLHNEPLEPTLNVTGNVEGSLLDDKVVYLELKNKLMHLTVGDTTPYYISFKATLKPK